jgi:hypothetical protein
MAVLRTEEPQEGGCDDFTQVLQVYEVHVLRIETTRVPRYVSEQQSEMAPRERVGPSVL